MENRKSYTDLVKAYAMTQIKNENFMVEIYAEMILQELLLTKRKEQIGKRLTLPLIEET